jgi:hypothetical protein
MARVDDYWNARKLAIDELAGEPFAAILARSGLESPADQIFRVPFLDRTYRVEYPAFEFSDTAQPDAEVPVQEQVLILHYMLGKETGKPEGDWVSYREIPGASFYFSAFVKRAIDPLKAVFGPDPEKLVGPAAKLGGEKIEYGDVGFEFRVFPKVPMRVILYAGDEEFTPEANILLDRCVANILSPEDIAWMAGMVVYRSIGLARSAG